MRPSAGAPTRGLKPSLVTPRCTGSKKVALQQGYSPKRSQFLYCLSKGTEEKHRGCDHGFTRPSSTKAEEYGWRCLMDPK